MTGGEQPGEHWALWRADPRATPFQSPAWLDSWWTHLGGGERRDVLIRDDTGALTAALPLFVWDDDGTRRLVPVGAGHSDYCDALLSPDGDAAALLAAVTDAADGSDEVLLPDVRDGSPLLGDAPAGWVAEDLPGEVCPVLTLPRDGDVLASLSKTRRRKVVHDRHRADRLGDVTVGFAATHEIDAALDALFALHDARWRDAGGGVLADPRVRAFHRAVVPALSSAKLLRLSVVRHAARIVAVLYGFADGTRCHSYINGVDVGMPEQSFGTLAFAHMIEAAAAAGGEEFHFLRGEEPYKYGWGAVPTATVRRVLRRGGGSVR